MEEHHDLSDEDAAVIEDDLLALTGESHPAKKGKKKRDANALRKAPNAPKRFKSSYICFFMAKQPEIKESLGDQATVTAISKRSAAMWKNLPAEERAHWDDVAAKDKQRYMIEKSQYTGPWQIPWKRAKKDPSAPKRPMSAFLYFSQGRRSQIKAANPEMKNTQVSRILGEMWRNLAEEDRRPHVEKEIEERKKYKVAMAEWKVEHEAKLEAQRKTEQQQQNFLPEGQAHLLGDPYAPPQAGLAGLVPNPYTLPSMQGFPTHYPTGPYNFPSNGKPVILGPNGLPVYPNSGATTANQPAQAAAYPQNTFDEGVNLQPNFDYTADAEGGAGDDNTSGSV